MDTATAADYLGLSRGALYHLVEKAYVPYSRMGRKLLFDRQALDRWITRRSVDVKEEGCSNSERSDGPR
jgi:excisionase family DNA binding protein